MAGSAVSRRDFLRGAAGAAAGALGFPYLAPGRALGKEGALAPSNRIVVGFIGVNWMGKNNLHWFLAEKDAQVAAVCDVDQNHLGEAARIVNNQYGNQDCATYHDYRELIGRADIDAVCLSLPDHWHAIPVMEAARAGKDIYGEKPLSHTFAEGLAMCAAVRRYGRVWQTGSWQRSEAQFRLACELVRNGRIGKVQRVEVGLPAGFTDFAQTKGQEAPGAPPAELDYDRWLGPAPWAPYCPARVHMNWRWVLDYGGGQLMDWVGHHVDIAHWGLDFDAAGPHEIEGHGEYPREGLWNTARRYWVEAKYPREITMIIAGGHEEIRGGTKWIGSDGWVWVNRNGIDAEPKQLLHERFGPSEVHLYESAGHVRNFLDCVKSRARTLAPVEAAHRSQTPGHLGQIAMQLGRKIRFDPARQEIIGDATATALLSRSQRSPWHW